MVGRGPRGGGVGRLSSLAKSERPMSARSTVTRLSGYLMPYRRDLTLGGIWVVLSSLASAVTPALTGYLIDIATGATKTHAGTNSLFLPGLALVGASIFGWLATREQIFRLGTAGQHALFDARADARSLTYEPGSSGGLLWQAAAAQASDSARAGARR